MSTEEAKHLALLLFWGSMLLSLFIGGLLITRPSEADVTPDWDKYTEEEQRLWKELQDKNQK